MGRDIIKIFKYEVLDILHSRWLIFYTLFFLLLTEGLFRLGGGVTKTSMSMMNVVIIVVPLFCIILGSMYLYNSKEFIQLLLTQPIQRSSLFWGIYLGLSIPLVISFSVGMGIPYLVHAFRSGQSISSFWALLGNGILLTFIFVGISYLVAILFDDRIRGLAMVIGLWLFFAVIYDGLVLFLIYTFSDYPLEKPIIGFTIFNPIDLARILLLLKFDISALMSYTGAVFEQFFGSILGSSLSLSALGLWIIIPLTAALRKFKHKDF
ncbi:MAG TPA: ABC transporter permease subunit [Balneolaceae bacterium]|nr:ABC transporter permease subunit [Balneolaceae bacterium]